MNSRNWAIPANRHVGAATSLALGLILLLAPASRAQQVAVSQLDGYVSDSSGQAIAGAQVKITEVDRDQVHTDKTDITGRYSFPGLPPGTYVLDVSYTGFKTYIQRGIVLSAGNNRTQPVTLEVGSTTESIEVTANASQVETRENSISQLISSQSLVDLPLNGRNPADLLRVSGIATSDMQLNGGDLTGSKNMQGSSGSGQYSVAGGAANGVNWLLDGGDNNDAFSNVNMPFPMPDAIEQYNVQTNSLPAQYGLHPAGVVNIVTKSGTNGFHGDLFEFFRNGDLNARQKGVTGQQPVRDSLKRNQWGGTIGGPIKRDKLFFFAGYQGTRQRSDPSNRIAYTPTQASLNGDFSVLDGAKSAGGCLATARQLKDPSGNPYPGNKIPVSSFDKAGLKLASSYLPVSSDPCGTQLYAFPANSPDDQIIGKVDWNISEKHLFFGRYFIYDYTGQYLFDGKNALTTGQSGNQDRSQTMTVGDTYTFTPNMINAIHATFVRRRDNRGATLFSPLDLGVNMFINIPTYTQLTVSGYSGGGFNIGCGTCASANFDINTYQFADDFTWIRGKHQLQFGFDGRKDQFNSFNYQQANGQFTFNGSTTGDGMADLLIGRFSGLTDGNVISDYLRQTVIAAYAQDAFKVSPHFSVNFGVRWEPSVPSYDKYGRGNQFSWPLFNQGWHSSVYPGAPAGLIFYGDSEDKYGKAFTASHWATFSPRLGMVIDPKGDGKQTIRAGFVLMHDTTELFYPERWTTNAPYVSSLTLTSGQFANPFANYVLNGKTGDPFPGASVFPTQGAYISVPGNNQVTYMMQWNLSYQRQMGKNWVAEANYLGNAGRHIWGSTDVNYAVYTGASATTGNTNNRRLTYLANPTLGQYYGNIQQTDDGNNSEYHALYMSLKHQFANHVSFTANYSWSHCVSSWDFAGELAGVLYQNPLSRAQGERGPCGYDHRQTFATFIVAQSPGIGNGIAKKLTADWQLAPVISANTGRPVQLSDGKDISLSGQGLDRPQVIAPDQVHQVAANDPTYWFNPAAFMCAGSNAACTTFSGQFGNLGRNALYGPGSIGFDMALTRRFSMTERWKLDFRADFFNIMNHANPSNPGTSLSSSTFGQITSFGSPRLIQMALKLYF
jgi:hypothetical protein